MIIDGHAVVAQDVDLLGNLLTALHTRLEPHNLRYPLLVDVLFDILCELGILEVLRVRVDGVDSRVALLVGTVLFECIEATGNLLRTLRDRLLQVTACR